MAAYEHQDWKTVVFHTKPKAAKIETVPKPQGTSSSSATGKPAWKIEKVADGEEGKLALPKVPKEVASQVIALRIKAKLTQQALATRVNMNHAVIRDIEAGTAIYNKAVVQKILRVLNSAS